MKKRIPILVTLAIIVAAGYRYISIIPENVGTGETAKSPNGRYEASAMEWHSESFWGRKRHWLRFEIKDVKSGAVVNTLETTPIEGPYFGSRSDHRVVFWSDDSREVRFVFPTVEIKMAVEADDD
ncbi:MAG: hypothetical protein JSU94_20715 [Phycisphaerales bacterium]|nr:MAG: hypothetical protein JSU94_20715 [Phycisphaerales bacterium]